MWFSNDSVFSIFLGIIYSNYSINGITAVATPLNYFVGEATIQRLLHSKSELIGSPYVLYKYNLNGPIFRCSPNNLHISNSPNSASLWLLNYFGIGML